MDLLVLLKTVGWFLLGLLGGSMVIVLVYCLIMNYCGYRLSYYLIRHYLDMNGRGNFPKVNHTAVGMDILQRIVWTIIYVVATSMIGACCLPYTPLVVGFLFAEVSFAFIAIWIEMHHTIRIGRLVSIDEVHHVAYFEGLDQLLLTGFTYTYEYSGNRKHFHEDTKYLVIDYPFFKMFSEIDYCEMR